MTRNNSSAKNVSDVQTQTNNDSGRGAIYGEASEERAAELHQHDVVYPEAEQEVELDTTIDGVSGSQLGQKGAEQARLDRGTDEAVNGSWGGPGGDSEYDDKLLYTQERIEGREAELEKISERAGANPDVQPRPEQAEQRRNRQMDLHQQRMTECKAEVEAEAASGTTSRGFVDDPRGHMEGDTLGEVNSQANRLAEQFGVTRPVVGKRLAEKVVRGADVSEAVLDLNEELVEERTVVTPLDKVDPTNSWVTVEGVVARMFEPASSNQQQVAVIEDASGDAKVTIWRHSGTDVRLNEGDVVRIVDGKPGTYNGEPTVAATSDTDVWRVEKDDGASPMGGVSVPEPTGAIGSIDDGPDVELDAEPETVEVQDDEESESEAEAEGVVIAETEDRSGVSWGSKKRQEAEKKGREKRLAERKYNIPEWKRTISRINSYEHQDLSPFGADQRMVEMDLGPLRNSE